MTHSAVTSESFSLRGEEGLTQDVNESRVSRPTKFERAVRLTLFFAVAIMPLFFGAVHRSVYLPLELIVFTQVIILLLVKREKCLRVLTSSRLVTVSSAALLIFALIPLTAYLVSSLLGSEPHPVVGAVNQVIGPSSFLSAIREPLFTLALFVLFSYLLFTSARGNLRVRNWLFLSAALVSLTALSHWFYDNGLLFWTFEPEHIFSSERARWPFVNANHLAHFLLLMLFPILATLEETVSNIGAKISRARVRHLSDAFSLHDLQADVVKALLFGVLLIAVVVAILGSQSRGSWLALGVTLLFYLVSSGRIYKSSSAALATDSEVKPRHSEKIRRRKRSNQDESSKTAIVVNLSRAFELLTRIYRPLLVFAAVLVISFFLNEHGQELVEGRLEYGLSYSKDDIRWTMYQDSMPMFMQHPFFGVGLGRWEDLFPQYASPSLAGVDAGYLHSDPLQLLIEVGIIGVLPLLFLSFVIIVRSVRAVFFFNSTEARSIRLRVLGRFSALVAFVLATFFDFPLRIPAILVAFIATLALLINNLASIEDFRTKRTD